MLEYDFNKLDNDFITLWSKYILWNDASSIIKPLERLAEKGQINAIQSWYLIKKQEEKNEKIDAIVDGYYGTSFNEALAIACREYDKSKLELKELRKQIAYYDELGYNFAKEYLNETQIFLADDKNKYYIERDRLIEEYRNTEYAKLLTIAADLTEQACKNAKTISVFERLFEIYAANPLVLDNDRISEKTIVELKKRARSVINNKKASEEDKTRLKFILGKNILFFSKKEKGQSEGTDIMFELSKRPLSIDKEIEREKIDGTDVMQDLTKSPLVFDCAEEKEA